MCGENKDCGCGPKEQAAHEAASGTVIAAGETVDGLPTRWHAVLIVEGLRTTDHRRIAEGALSWRQLPLALFAQFENAGHGGAAIVGTIDTITREPWKVGTTLLMGGGTFNLETDEGKQAAQMCRDQILRWGSADMEVLESQYVEIGGGGGGDLLDVLFMDDMSAPSDWYDEVTLGRIMGWTMVATPAFPQAVIAPEGTALDIPEPMAEAPMVDSGLMASGVSVPNEPPADWFTDPQLLEATPMVITEEGRVFGHLALWGKCHTGFSDTCVMAPQSSSDYAYFKTGEVKCAEGSTVRVGQLTFNTGHAKATLGWQDTTHHYDHTGHVAADVTVGEDEHGVWFAGALRPGLNDEQIRTFRASALSGDWRKIGGGLELVAALAVNVPGFPIVASGKRGDEQVSLIAAAPKKRDPMEVMAHQIAELRRAVAPLMPLAKRELIGRMNRTSAANTKPTLDSLRERIHAVQ